MGSNKLDLFDKLDLLKEGIDYQNYTNNYEKNKCNGCCSKKHKCCIGKTVRRIRREPFKAPKRSKKFIGTDCRMLSKQI